MKLLTALSILSVFFLVGAEDKPQPCTSPKLFEGQIYESWIGKFIDNYVTFSYDAIQKRIYAMRVKITQGVPGDPVVDYLLFKQKIAYQFYPKNKTCMKYPLRFPFRPIAVPKNATFISQTYVGSSASPVDGLLINVWILKSDIGFDSLSFTAHGCFPLSVMAYNKMAGWSLETFMNLTTGIRNPGIFEPPEECLKEEYSQEHPLQESDQNPHFSHFL